MPHQLSLLDDPTAFRLDPAATAALGEAVTAARRTLGDVTGARAGRHRALCDWVGPARRRHDHEVTALDDAAQDLDLSLAHLALALQTQLRRLESRRTRPR